MPITGIIWERSLNSFGEIVITSFTVDAVVVVDADAAVTVHQVDTATAVLARVAGAFLLV